jgi:alcohol dehydrogenase class IV
MKAMNSTASAITTFEFHTTRSIAVEVGGAKRLGARIAKLGYCRPFVVTDPGLLQAGVLESALASLSAEGLQFRVYSDVEADPPEFVIEAASVAARNHQCDCIVGFGGGSSMDVAKLVALLVASGQPLAACYGVDNATGPRLPMILVPTTAGTGSEVTPISIVTTGLGEKKGVVSKWLLPDVALLDAELTVGLPAHVTAATGIDAMVHAIEAYTSKRLKNPISDCLAREALRLLSGSLHAACTQGADMMARENMLLGASLAGMAFANAPVAAVHALAYPVGARFHVPHGLSNSLVLAPVIRFNQQHAASRYAELFDVVKPGVGGTEDQRAAGLARYLASLPGELKLPTRLRDVGITSEDIPALAEDAMKQTRLLINNPREVDLAAATALYQEAL